MATQTSQNTQITDIPEWMKKYMSSSDKNYSGILDEAMRGYRARSGSMTDEQLRNLKMPTRSVAGRTALQNQADAMATSGVGSYMPMLQAGAYTVGSGVQGVGRAQQMIGDAYQGATPYRDFATEQMKNAITSSQGAGARGQAAAGAGARGIMQASQAARGMGQYGMGASQAGIAGLQGSAAEFDPASIQKYMNPYESSVIDAAMADVARAGQQQQNQLGAGAVGAGSFGGSRQGIAQGEISRNTLDQQAKTASGMRQAGYESASNRAQNAYEQARQRQQSAAGMTSQMGQAGAATGLNATQLGMQGAQQAGAMGMQGAQMGLQTANQMGQLGQNVGNLGYQYGNMGMNAANQYGAMAQGLGSMGMQQAQLGEAQQGLAMNDYNQLARIGQQQQGLNQAQLDATYQNQYQQYQQPMQDLGFYSDIYQGMPIGQSSYTQSSAPGPSAVSQIGGLAGGLYGMYRANQ